MTQKPGKFADGTLLGSEKSGEVSVVGEENQSGQSSQGLLAL